MNCPNCGEQLMYMMPDAYTLCCTKCKKYFINENGNVGDETTYPYTNSNADY